MIGVHNHLGHEHFQTLIFHFNYQSQTFAQFWNSGGINTWHLARDCHLDSPQQVQVAITL